MMDVEERSLSGLRAAAAPDHSDGEQLSPVRKSAVSLHERFAQTHAATSPSTRAAGGQRAGAGGGGQAVLESAGGFARSGGGGSTDYAPTYTPPPRRVDPNVEVVEELHAQGELAPLTANQLQAYIKAFEWLDDDGDGMISPKDFGTKLSELGTHNSRDDQLAAALGVIAGGPSEVNLLAFMKEMAAEMEGSLALSSQQVKALFQLFDRNGDGTLDRWELEEVMELMGEEASTNEIMSLIKEFDVNADGALDVHEFAQMLNILPAGERKSKAKSASRRSASARIRAHSEQRVRPETVESPREEGMEEEIQA